MLYEPVENEAFIITPVFSSHIKHPVMQFLSFFCTYLCLCDALVGHLKKNNRTTAVLKAVASANVFVQHKVNSMKKGKPDYGKMCYCSIVEIVM